MDSCLVLAIITGWSPEKCHPLKVPQQCLREFVSPEVYICCGFFLELGLVPLEDWGSPLRADGSILGPWKVPGTPQIMPSRR